MKKLLLALVAAPCLATAADPQNNDQGHTRFWDYYNPYPSNYIGSREWLDGDALLGDFWGLRNMIDDAGVEISATYGNNIAGNVTGGKKPGLHLRRQPSLWRGTQHGEAHRLGRPLHHRQRPEPKRHESFSGLHRQPIHRAADLRWVSRYVLRPLVRSEIPRRQGLPQSRALRHG